MSNGTDTAWDEIVSVAERLTQLSADTVTVWAFRRRTLLGVTEGLEFGDLWVEGDPMPIRRRRWFSDKWKSVRSIQEAAAEIEWFLRNRPDGGARPTGD